MLQYSLEVAICWAILYLVYITLLRKETFFGINRFYLLSSLAVGLLIPIIRFIPSSWQQEAVLVNEALHYISAGPSIIAANIEPIEKQISIWSISNLLLLIYMVGVMLFVSRLLYGLSKILNLYREGDKSTTTNFTLIETSSFHLPFSFMNCVFISKELPLQGDIEKILKHELAHVQLWHSLDVLFIESLQILFWFNPLIYLYKKAIKESHEYVADATVLEDTSQKIYGQILLRQSQSGLQIALANHFFHSHIKKRLTMMKQKKSKRPAMIKYLLAVPFILLLAVLFQSQVIPKEESSEVTLSQGETYFQDEDLKIKVLGEIALEEIGLGEVDMANMFFEKGTLNSKYILIDGIEAQMPLKNEIDISKPIRNIFMYGSEVAVAKFGSKAEKGAIVFEINSGFLSQELEKDFEALYHNTSHGSGIRKTVLQFQNLLDTYIDKDQAKTKVIKNSFVRIANRFGMRVTFIDDTNQFADFQFILPAEKLEDYQAGLLPEYESMVSNDKIWAVPDMTSVTDYYITVDGEEVDSKMFEGKKFDAEYIEVLTPKTAMEKIGKTGKGGAMIITGLTWAGEKKQPNSEISINSAKVFVVHNEDKITGDLLETWSIDTIPPAPPSPPTPPGAVQPPKPPAPPSTEEIWEQIKDPKSEMEIYIGDNKVSKKDALKMKSYLQLVMVDIEGHMEKMRTNVKFKKPKVPRSSTSFHGGINETPLVMPTKPLEGYTSNELAVLFENLWKIIENKNSNLLMVIDNKTSTREYAIKNKDNLKIVVYGDGLSGIDVYGEKGKFGFVMFKSNESNSIANVHKDDEIFKVVQQMPRFPGCEDMDGTNQEKEDCAKKKMLEFIYTNIQYPAEAREAGIEGTNVVQFVIEADGSLSEIKLVRDIGGKTGIVAEDVIHKMNALGYRWTPGYQRGKAVRVQYTLPIRFKLAGESDENKISEISLKSEKDVQPLFVIDGEIVKKRSKDLDLNPDDIERIDVLKGEKAFDKYGSIAQNGVVEITTKKAATKERVNKESTSEIFKVVEEMPRFPGCERMEGTLEEKRTCSNESLLKFIYTNIRYPQEARESGHEGMAVVQFVIDKNGNVKDENVVRDVEGAFEESILTVIDEMRLQNKIWIPGKQRGKNVSVLFTLPVSFKLEGENEQIKHEKIENDLATYVTAFKPDLIVNVSTISTLDNVELNIESTHAGPASISVFNAAGQLVLSQEKNIAIGKNVEQLNINNGVSGLYVVKVVQGQKQVSKKLILQ